MLNKWISIKDKLPNHKKIVICYFCDIINNDKGTDNYFLGYYSHSEKSWFGLRDESYGDQDLYNRQYMITHWIELPEVPE